MEVDHMRPEGNIDRYNTREVIRIVRSILEAYIFTGPQPIETPTKCLKRVMRQLRGKANPVNVAEVVHEWKFYDSDL